jgi:hypothetical protein
MVYLFFCFANPKNDVYWQLCIVWVYVQTNLGLFSNVHMLFELASILPLVEGMQSLLKFAQ